MRTPRTESIGAIPEVSVLVRSGAKSSLNAGILFLLLQACIHFVG